MANEPRVYLDHLIQRENLRFKRSEEQLSHGGPAKQLSLRISDLRDSNDSRVRFLRKPDFQRASWAWTPEDCVSLLDSLVNDQVIPSLIMWYSQESTLDYVLDGAHRISVVLAWLRDDWGDKLPHYHDQEEEHDIKRAARMVRELVQQRIGTLDDYIKADQAIEVAINESKAPKDVVEPAVFNRGQFYRKLVRGDISFPILWVLGDYERAEQSFLKINKSGQQLLEWETRLIENRNSSFARAVLSLASVRSASHYWLDKEYQASNKDELEQKKVQIMDGIEKLDKIFFVPPYSLPINSLQQPMLGAPEVHLKPVYLAELLTVVAGGKGQPPETEKLISRDRYAPPEKIIESGWALIRDTLEAFEHISGPSPKSLALVPALYFYTEEGRHVRSLLYGLLYWLLSGTDQEILARKRLFAAHRAAFEQILLNDKSVIVGGPTRKSGSGPDITVQTASFYQKLLQLLMDHKDDIKANEFLEGYGNLTNEITGTSRRSRHTDVNEIRSRLFTPRQKTILNLKTLLTNPPRCGICDGVVDIQGPVQYDHIIPYSQGGPTSLDNQRLTHPFCNNHANRHVIEQLRTGQQQLLLPHASELDPVTGARQLSFLTDVGFK